MFDRSRADFREDLMSLSLQEGVSQETFIVSVLVPLHNAEPFIQVALASILQETRIPLEVIVINDRSTDHSVAKVNQIQDARIRLIQSAGRGIAETLNTGLNVAKGEIIVRCDADDWYPPDRLFRQVEWLQQHPDYGAICGSYLAVDPHGKPITCLSVGDAGEITSELLQGMTRTHLGTFAIRAEVLQTLGGFRRYFVSAEDIDLQLRLSHVCKVWYEPDPGYCYRIHAASITHTQKSSEREFFEAIARSCLHQRLSRGWDDVERGCAPLPPARPDQPFRAPYHIQGFLLGRAWQVFQAGHKGQALLTGLRAALTAPTNVSVWQSWVAMLVKVVVAF